MSRFLAEVLNYRRENQRYCHERIKGQLKGSMRTAFTYILQLGHEEKPDYQLIKLYMASSDADEACVINSKLLIKNDKMARDILYDHDLPEIEEPEQDDDILINQANRQLKPKTMRKEEAKAVKDNRDLDKDHDFCEGVDEQKENDEEGMILNYKKIDNDKVKRIKVRDFILHH